MIIIKGLLYICGVFSFFAILFRLGIIPPIFGYADNYQQINEVIMNISYSYLAGLIFYLLKEDKYPDVIYGIKLSYKNIGFNGKFYIFPYFLTFLLKRFVSERIQYKS